MRSQHSKPQLEEPSGRYQVFAGDVTPTLECPSGEAAPGPVHSMVRSTAMVSPSVQVILVEKSLAPSLSAGFTVVWEDAGRVMVPPETLPVPVM